MVKTSKPRTKKNKNLPNSKNTRRRYKDNHVWWWVLVFVALFVVTIVVVMINIRESNKTSAELINEIAIDNSDLKVNWDRYQTTEIDLVKSVNISQSGTYHITGALENGQIVVDAGVGEVRLILDNVSIANSSGPAILCYNAENFVIELVGENILKDGETYASDYDHDVEGAIYSKADLAIYGDGSLDIQSFYADAIVGKDDVVLRGGDYKITAKDDAIRGKDSVYITDGTFKIDSMGNAVLANNDTEKGKGFVLIENGNFTIETGAKGLKATNHVLISSGNFKINSYDDAIHSDNYVGLTAGSIDIHSGDDGIHANNTLIIDGGTVNITKSYEGLEAQVIAINGGEVNVTASDDGLNAGGGADNSSQNRPGANPFNVDEDCMININGGNIYVNAAGDGIDSNGYLIFNGGKVVVDGPTNNGNGALDAGAGISIQGGEVLAIGAAGMAESLGDKSNICNLSLFFSNAQKAGTVIEIKDSAGNIIASHTAVKSFSHLAFGSEALILGETYKVYLNNTEYTSFTILEVTTTIGNSGPSLNMIRR